MNNERTVGWRVPSSVCIVIVVDIVGWWLELSESSKACAGGVTRRDPRGEKYERVASRGRRKKKFPVVEVPPRPRGGRVKSFTVGLILSCLLMMMTRRHSRRRQGVETHLLILSCAPRDSKMGAKQRRVGSQDAPKSTEAVKSRHKREKDFATVKKLCQVGTALPPSRRVSSGD